MAKELFVGNLPWETTQAELEELVGQYATVTGSKIITDRETGRSRGFGFVRIYDEDLDKAIAALNDMELGGRKLTVNEARGKQGGGNRREPSGNRR